VDRAPRFVVPVLPGSLSLALIPSFDPLIQRLENSRVHRGDDIHRRVELFFRHPRFPCVRKAPVNSWITEAHHRDGEADEHLFPVGETFDGVGIAVKSSEIGFLQGHGSFSLTTSRKLLKNPLGVLRPGSGRTERI